MSMRLNNVSTQAISTSPATQQPSAASQKLGRSISYAETTKIFVDDAVRKKLKDFGESTIRMWTDKGITSESSSFSVRDARMINQEAGVQVFDLSAENIKIEKFTIDSAIREQLENLPDLAKASKALRFSSSSLSQIKTGKIFSIRKEQADAYNRYFNRNLFDSQRIFQSALEEPIKKEKNLAKSTWITISLEHREELKHLPNKKQLNRWVKNALSEIIRQSKIAISVKDAVHIHKISGKIIFAFNKEAIAKFPILPAHIDELEILTKKLKEEKNEIAGEVSDIYHRSKSRNLKYLTIKLAEDINALAGKKVFDYESILDQAVQQATDEEPDIQLAPPTKKRSRRDSTVSTTRRQSKKQRIGGGTDQPVAAIVLDDSQSSLPAPSAPLDFQDSLTAPQGPEKIAIKPSFRVNFILN